MKNIFTLLLIAFCFTLSAQSIGFGFRAGLNFNSFAGDSETDANGAELEDFTSNTGFHVGATFTWKATDLMGVRGEFVYNQKGGRRSFEGPSYLTLTTTSGNDLPTTGTRKQNLNITTSYFDFPITGYFKPIPSIEVYGGVNVGFLVAANVFGEVNYSGSNFEAFRYEVDGNYQGDRHGAAVFDTPSKTVSVGNSTVEVPSSAGVYYEFTEDMGNLYKTVEMGAVGGISIFLNGSLFVAGRINYSLNDITKEAADVALTSKNGDQFILRDDDDRNLSIQASIGFSF